MISDHPDDRIALPYSLICHTCAMQRGGRVPHGRTTTAEMGACPYCHVGGQPLYGIHVYSWPFQTEADE